MSTRCSTADIADKLVKARKDKKGVTLILGKECSESAGVPTAEEYIDVIKEKFPQAYEKAEKKDLAGCISHLGQEEKSDLTKQCIESVPVNWTHICVALLLKNGFVDRVMTINTDPLLRKACALVGEFPPVFDCAVEQIKISNHIPDKSIIHLYGQEIGIQPGSLNGVFGNFSKKGPCIVVGHNGQKDLVHNQLQKEEAFDEGLHWVFSNGAENKKSVVEDILTKEKNGFHTGELSTDSFFIALTQKLMIFPPEIILHPFTHLAKILNGLASFPIPGQKEGYAITDLLLLQTQSSIEQFEEVEAGAEDFGANQDTSLLDDEDHLAAILEARNGLLMGDTAKILKHAKQYEETPSLQLGNLLHWAYITKGTPLLSKALSQPKDEALGLLEEAGEYFQAALGIHADDQDVLIKYGKIITEQAKLASGEDAEKLFALAAEKFNGILELNPDQHEASYNLGLALIEQANARSDDSSDDLYEKAISGFENAVKGNPNHFDSYYGWGYALSAQARKKKGADALRLFGQAAEKYQAALKIKPTSYEALLQMGHALMVFSKGKKKEEADRVLAMAEDKFQSAIKIRSDSHDAFFGLGEALHKRGIKGPADKLEEFLNKAIENFKTALTLKPNFPRVNYHWGLSLSYLAERKKGEEAEEVYSLAAEKFQIAMKINPSNFEALTRWGNVIYQLSWFKSGNEAESLLTQATEKYGAALKINPNHPEAFTSWGNVFLRLAQLSEGDSAEEFLAQAIEKYQLALKIKPESINALSNWGNALFESAKLKSGTEAENLYAQAEEKFQGALKIRPNDFNALTNWGSILYKRGLGEPAGKGDPYFIKAQKCFESALEIKPDYPDALKGMGESLVEQARTKKGINVHPLLAEAKAKLTRAEELQPGISTFNMALIMAMLANESECKSWLEKCLENGTLPNGETLMNDSRLANMRESKWFKVLAAPPVKSDGEASKDQESETPEISLDEISEPTPTENTSNKTKDEPALKTESSSSDEVKTNKEDTSLTQEPDAKKS
jgi:tetratricopeptide (TPR) repeat protein